MTWENSKLIFTNSGMICNCSGAKEIWKAKIAKLRAVVATTYHNDKWSYKWVNLKSGYNVGSSQENLTRSLC